jgi:hypothetical protein
MGVSAGPPARKAMLTNPAQLRKYVVRCMRKLLEKSLMTVSGASSTCWQGLEGGGDDFQGDHAVVSRGAKGDIHCMQASVKGFAFPFHGPV